MEEHRDLLGEFLGKVDYELYFPGDDPCFQKNKYDNLGKSKYMPELFRFAVQFRSMTRIMDKYLDDIVHGNQEFNLDEFKSKCLEASPIFIKLQAFSDAMEEENDEKGA